MGGVVTKTDKGYGNKQEDGVIFFPLSEQSILMNCPCTALRESQSRTGLCRNVQCVSHHLVSKKKKRELDAAKRTTWGALNPVTRKTPNPRAYDRQKARRWKFQNHPDVPSVFMSALP